MNKIFNFKINQKGFALAELLIAIIAIGGLAVGVMVFLDPVKRIQESNDMKRKSDLSQIQKAIDKYYRDIGQYPKAADNKIKGLDGSTADWGTQWLPYMDALPKDPSGSRNYVYCSSSGQSYYLYANLERGAGDFQACNGGSECANFPANCPKASCGVGVMCNYGVSSPNVSP